MSVVGNAARSLSAGQWAQLTQPSNISFLRDTVPGGQGTILQYVDKMNYDPYKHRGYLANSDDPGDYKHFGYLDFATWAYVEVSGSPWPPGSGGQNHTYGQGGVDVRNQVVFLGWGTTQGGPVLYNASTGAFNQLGNWNDGSSQSDAPGSEFFPERNSFIYVRNGIISERNAATGAKTQITGNPQIYTHTVCHYNGFYKCLVFGGGNFQTVQLYRLDANGTLTQLTMPPTGLDCVRYKLTEDPTTGLFIMTGYEGSDTGPGVRYSFNPMNATSGAWINLGISGVPAAIFPSDSTSSNAYLSVTCLVPEHKVHLHVVSSPGADPLHFIYKYAT